MTPLLRTLLPSLTLTLALRRGAAATAPWSEHLRRVATGEP